MKRGIHCLVLLAAALVICSAGCMESWERLSGASAEEVFGPGSAPPAGYGSIDVSSSPWGAEVYVDGLYKGKTPVTVRNVPAGTHEVILSKSGYADATQEVTVTADASVSVKRTLTVPKPDIYITVTSTSTGYNAPKCYWEVSGTVSNSGAGTAKDMVLTLELTPTDTAYDKASTEKRIGYLNPGETREFYIWVDATSCSDYTGKLTYVYYDADDKKHSGTAKSI
ncbi:MAG: PEGA domain-containing protein [Methanomicrobiaceae archaeon]|nr:PEGA domain-containing protein [Methanomicrobiaceae archaeon]